MRQHNQAGIWRIGKSGDAARGFIAVPDADGGYLNAERRRHGFHRAQEFKMHRGVGMHDHPRLHDGRRDLLKQPEPFAADRRLEILETGEIAVGVREAADEPATDGVRDLDKDGR